MLNKYIIILLLLNYNTSFASSVLITQGEVYVTLEDVDGFAYRIPVNKRAGFFEDPQRIDETLTNIVNMKIINNYALQEGLLDESKINKQVDIKIDQLVKFDPKSNNFFQQEKEYKLIKNFLLIEERYARFKNIFTNNLDVDQLVELAMEIYAVNSSSYYTKESRDVNYLLFAYNDENQSEVYQEVKKILLNGTNSISETLYKDILKQTEIELFYKTKTLIKNDRMDLFLKSVFSQASIGVIPKIIDSNSNYILVDILKINSSKPKKFEDVKTQIINVLKKDMLERSFADLLFTLTQDEVIVNKDNIISIRTRYLQ